MSTPTPKKKVVKINTRIDGPISKEDYHRNATISDLKASRLLTERNINVILHAFTQQRTQFESRFNILWNITSSVIQYLDEKGIMIVGDFAKIGLELRALHRRNMDAIRKATTEKRRITDDEIEKAPIDRLLAAMENIPAKPTLVRTDVGCEDVPEASNMPTEPAPPQDQEVVGFNCGNCEADVPADASACPSCGAEFEAAPNAAG